MHVDSGDSELVCRKCIRYLLWDIALLACAFFFLLRCVNKILVRIKT